MPKSGITKDELINWGGEDVFNQALALCNSGDVVEVKYDDESLTITGKIMQGDGWAMPTGLKLEAIGRIKSECPCITNRNHGMVCSHVVALGIALMVNEMDEDECPEQANDGDKTEEESAPNYIEVPMTPKFYAFIAGSRAALSIELDAYYNEINFPACSMQAERTVYLEDPDDNIIRRTRSVNLEKAAVRELEKWGFEPGYREGDFKLYLTSPQKILAFLGGGFPAFRRRANWQVEMSERLSAVYDTFKNVVPVVRLKDAEGGDFDVSYSFDAGGMEISSVEIQAALNRHDGCLLKDGQVYLIDEDAINKMHDVFADCASAQGKAEPGWFRVRGVYAPYVRSSLENLLDAIDMDDSMAEKWRANSARNGNVDAKYEAISLGNLDSVLRPYQKQGVYWLHFLDEAGHCGLLADEMGLGKTLQTLTWLSILREGKGKKLPALIVCPTSLVRNWEAEAQKFTPWLKTIVISGPERAKLFRRIPENDIAITSYALIQRDFDAAYLEQEFSAVILDEAQHIKNRETKNAKAVKALNCNRRLVLTGTPIENSVADVWSIFNFLMPDYLGDYQTFKLNFEDPIREENSEAALEKLKRKLNPFILRRLKKTVAKDLPDKIVKISYCPMSEDAQRDYNEALMKTRTQAGSVVRAKGFAKSKFEILAMLMKLRQISSRAKLESFMEQLQSAIAGGHKILVFSQFVSMLKLIADELKRDGISFCYLDGSTKNRLAECERFNRNDKIPVFLISLMAGGTGLNLTGADMVMHYDPWWNPAVEDQATDRAHRIGQKKTVYVIKMIASGSIEEKVLALQRKKQAIISATVSTTDAAIMESLSAADLNELLS